MASKAEEAAAAQPLTGEHGDKETNGDALPAIEDNRSVGLKKEVTLLNGIALVVGVIIGSGIFISPTGVLKRTGSVGMSLVVWAGCGFLALLGSLCYCEMGTMIPKSGAEYSYLYEAFGALPAFLYSWTLALIIRPSSLSVVALTFARYVSQPFFTDCDISPIPVRKILAATCLGELYNISVKPHKLMLIPLVSLCCKTFLCALFLHENRWSFLSQMYFLLKITETGILFSFYHIVQFLISKL